MLLIYNANAHWSGAAVVPSGTTATMYHFDSLGIHDPLILCNLINAACSVLGSVCPYGNITACYRVQVEQQQNGYDCGFFTVRNLRAFAQFVMKDDVVDGEKIAYRVCLLPKASGAIRSIVRNEFEEDVSRQ